MLKAILPATFFYLVCFEVYLVFIGFHRIDMYVYMTTPILMKAKVDAKG
jgi:hypothetical protein